MTGAVTGVDGGDLLLIALQHGRGLDRLPHCHRVRGSTVVVGGAAAAEAPRAADSITARPINPRPPLSPPLPALAHLHHAEMSHALADDFILPPLILSTTFLLELPPLGPLFCPPPLLSSCSLPHVECPLTRRGCGLLR